MHLIHLMTIMISSCTIVTDKAENYRHFKYSDEFSLANKQKTAMVVDAIMHRKRN